jgi:hypothetical protein
MPQQLSAFLFLALLTAGCVSSLPGVDSEELVGTREYIACVDRVLGVADDLLGIPTSYRFATVIRPHDCNVERQVSIQVGFDGKVSAKYVTPLGKTVFDQLNQLKRMDPTGDPLSLCKSVKSQTVALESESQTTLHTFMNTLAELRVPVVIEENLYLHGASYEIWTLTTTGAAYFEIHTPPLDLEGVESSNPLALWVRDMVESLGVPCEEGEIR